MTTAAATPQGLTTEGGRSTRFNVTGNPPPDLNRIFRVLDRECRRGRSLSGTAEIRGAIARVGGEYKKPASSDDCQRFLQNTGVMVKHPVTGRFHFDAARAEVIRVHCEQRATPPPVEDPYMRLLAIYERALAEKGVAADDPSETGERTAVLCSDTEQRSLEELTLELLRHTEDDLRGDGVTAEDLDRRHSDLVALGKLTTDELQRTELESARRAERAQIAAELERTRAEADRLATEASAKAARVAELEAKLKG